MCLFNLFGFSTCVCVGCGAVWCGVVWCDLVWCDVICVFFCVSVAKIYLKIMFIHKCVSACYHGKHNINDKQGLARLTEGRRWIKRWLTVMNLRQSLNMIRVPFNTYYTNLIPLEVHNVSRGYKRDSATPRDTCNQMHAAGA